MRLEAEMQRQQQLQALGAALSNQLQSPAALANPVSLYPTLAQLLVVTGKTDKLAELPTALDAMRRKFGVDALRDLRAGFYSGDAMALRAAAERWGSFMAGRPVMATLEPKGNNQLKITYQIDVGPNQPPASWSAVYTPENIDQLMISLLETPEQFASSVTKLAKLPTEIGLMRAQTTREYAQAANLEADTAQTYQEIRHAEDLHPLVVQTRQLDVAQNEAELGKRRLALQQQYGARAAAAVASALNMPPDAIGRMLEGGPSTPHAQALLDTQTALVPLMPTIESLQLSPEMFASALYRLSLAMQTSPNSLTDKDYIVATPTKVTRYVRDETGNVTSIEVSGAQVVFPFLPTMPILIDDLAFQNLRRIFGQAMQIGGGEPRRVTKPAPTAAQVPRLEGRPGGLSEIIAP